MVVGLALVPQMIGHNSLLWAVRYIDASLVSVVVLLEPVGATLLAWLLFGTPPTGFEVLGGFVLLIGVVLVVRARSVHTTSTE
jgi:drug/metabolite transporter (DMT)-like permease